MRALLGEHSFHDRVSKFFRTKATLALSKKPQPVARGETVEKVRFGRKSFYPFEPSCLKLRLPLQGPGIHALWRHLLLHGLAQSKPCEPS